MATAWQLDLSYIQQIVGGTGIIRGTPAHVTSGSRPLGYNQASRCRTVRSPALPLPGKCAGGCSRDGASQGQERLWRQLFLGSALWWDDRRGTKRFRAPDFRREWSSQVLLVNNTAEPTPAWADEELVCLDLRMGRGSSWWKRKPVEKNEPGRRGGSGMGVVTGVTVGTLCQQGKLNEAVGALEYLAKAEGAISESLFYSVLKLCAAKRDLVLGRRVHDLTVKLGYESNSYLGNHILRMYASGGRLQEAMDVFTRVGKPNAFMWFSIISAHVKHGKPNEAIQRYHAMRGSGVTADAHVFVAALQACALAMDLESGRGVHCDVLNSRMAPNLYVGNSLVDMYAKCGALKDARQVFDSLTAKDVVTWNSLIAGYAQQGLGQEALGLYGQMEEEGLILANQVTFSCILKACASAGALQKGREVHSQIVQRGLLDNMLVSTCLLDMYAKCGALKDARLVFDSLATKDVVTWNALIAGYANQGLCQEALVLYGQMEQEGIVVPDHVTFAGLLKACASVGALKKGRQLHTQIVKRGLIDDIVLGNALVDMYAKCGEMRDAQGVFDSLASKNVVTWTALIAGYAQQGLGEEALVVYGQMEQEGLILANHVTFACLLKVCASTGALQKGRELHSQIVESGLLDNILVGSCLIDMYAKCGELEDARRVFDSLATKSVVTWTALISGCGACDEGHSAVACFEAMLDASVQPDEATFTCLLAACSHEGLVHEGRKHFDSMAEQHGINPTIEHYNCMIDLLGRAGHLDEAESMLVSCGSQSNAVGLTSLLSSCKSYGDVERAIRCFESLVTLEPQGASAYVLMATAYADAGRWADVDRIEKRRMMAGANKKPAMATIEVEKQVHTFVVGENREDIALKVGSMNKRLQQEGGHVPLTELVLKPLHEKEKEDQLCGHAEKLALAYGLLNTSDGTPLLVTKNLRMCSDCHSSTEVMSRVEKRDIVVRDGYRVHRFAAGGCSCRGRP